MAELRRRKADDESKLDENEQGGGGDGTDGGAGTDDDSKQPQHQHQHKRKTSSGLNTADSSDHVNIPYPLNELFCGVRIRMCRDGRVLVRSDGEGLVVDCHSFFFSFSQFRFECAVDLNCFFLASVRRNSESRKRRKN